jgi:O-succinylbenzoate synthase
MNVWVLILTLTSGQANGGQAIAHIPGFSTQDKCNAAAAAWLETAVREHSPIHPAAVCVAAR